MRNSERVNIVAFWLTAHASFEMGKTVAEISDATGISVPAVKRILREAGFTKSQHPLFPQGWYFDPAVQARLANSVKQQTKREAEAKEHAIGSIVNRPYYTNVDNLPVGLAFDKAASAEVIRNWLDKNVKEYVESMTALIQNINEFSEGDAKLDRSLLITAQQNAKDMLYNGETIMRAVGKILDIDPTDPEYWAHFLGGSNV